MCYLWNVAFVLCPIVHHRNSKKWYRIVREGPEASANRPFLFNRPTTTWKDGLITSATLVWICCPVPPTRTVFFNSSRDTRGLHNGRGPPTSAVLNGLGLRRHQLPTPPPIRRPQRRNLLLPILEEIMELHNVAYHLGRDFEELCQLDREFDDQLVAHTR